jgi:hypothetical protein
MMEFSGKGLTAAITAAIVTSGALDIYLLVTTDLHWRVTGTISSVAAALVFLAVAALVGKRR